MIICPFLVRLISFKMAARVVDLPEPVSPVTRISPRFMDGNWETAGGSPRLSSSGIRPLSSRMAAEICPCCRNRLIRTRMPAKVPARSSSPISRIRSYASPASSLA